MMSLELKGLVLLWDMQERSFGMLRTNKGKNKAWLESFLIAIISVASAIVFHIVLPNCFHSKLLFCTALLFALFAVKEYFHG